MEMISRHGGKGRGVIGHTIPDRSIIIWVVNRHGSLSSLERSDERDGHGRGGTTLLQAVCHSDLLRFAAERRCGR